MKQKNGWDAADKHLRDSIESVARASVALRNKALDLSRLLAADTKEPSRVSVARFKAKIVVLEAELFESMKAHSKAREEVSELRKEAREVVSGLRKELDAAKAALGQRSLEEDVNAARVKAAGGPEVLAHVAQSMQALQKQVEVLNSDNNKLRLQQDARDQEVMRMRTLMGSSRAGVQTLALKMSHAVRILLDDAKRCGYVPTSKILESFPDISEPEEPKQGG